MYRFCMNVLSEALKSRKNEQAKIDAAVSGLAQETLKALASLLTREGELGQDSVYKKFESRHTAETPSRSNGYTVPVELVLMFQSEKPEEQNLSITLLGSVSLMGSDSEIGIGSRRFKMNDLAFADDGETDFMSYVFRPILAAMKNPVSRGVENWCSFSFHEKTNSDQFSSAMKKL